METENQFYQPLCAGKPFNLSSFSALVLKYVVDPTLMFVLICCI